jgi:hypothetical protein
MEQTKHELAFCWLLVLPADQVDSGGEWLANFDEWQVRFDGRSVAAPPRFQNNT